MLDPTLLELLTEVVRHVNLPGFIETAQATEAQASRPQSGFNVKPGAVPPEAASSSIEQVTTTDTVERLEERQAA